MSRFFLYILSYRPDVDFDRAYDVFFLGLEANLHEAIKWLKKSSGREKGNGVAHYNLGYVYANARDEFDFEEARNAI